LLGCFKNTTIIDNWFKCGRYKRLFRGKRVSDSSFTVVEDELAELDGDIPCHWHII
jgi:hypothetical protein